MGIRSAMPDRARTVRKEGTAKVEGTKQKTVVYSEWFRCRFELSDSTEGDADGRKRHQVSPSLMVAKRDMAGQNVSILNRDQLEVQTNQTATTLYEVTGVGPIRKRRSVIGWRVQVTKVEP